MEEYIVSLSSHEELGNFYDDMETLGGTEFVPKREVECSLRRPISRNTHYNLTEKEVKKLKEDNRVIDICPASALTDIVRKPLYTQTSTEWNKSSTSGTNQKNWSLLRCVEGTQISNWGSNGTAQVSGTINLTSSGRNVDFILVDGHINPNHPEFAKNSDGTGGTRVNQFNWYSLTSLVTGGANGTYVYTPYTDAGNDALTADNNHGMHVGGSASGNTQGWARDVNIYNINPYSSSLNTLASDYIFDYIRSFHNTKPINSILGIKNPTICNNSWGAFYQITRSTITNINWRGTSYTSSFTDGLFNSVGLRSYDATNLYIPAWTTALTVDIEDAIADGVLFVGASGNESTKIDILGGADYNNTITWSGVTRNYSRGDYVSSSGNAICVGAVSALVNESKATFSNCGPRVNVYSPGDNIISCLHNGVVSGGTITTVNDPRDSTYKLGKYDGTSMASPQVCGILASTLEQYPRMKQSDAVDYIEYYAKSNQITETGRSTFTWDVTNSGASDYVFSGFSSGNDISITVQEGSILVFNINAPGHPFWIKTAQVTGTVSAVTTGTITGNGSESETVIWNTYGVKPGTYYYICQFHSTMSGTITITAAYTDDTSLQGSDNKFVFFQKDRKDSGVLQPRPTFKSRSVSGQVWPRQQTLYYKK
jgi:hypothetical protein